MLLVATKVYRQQSWLAEQKKSSISDRIVSLSQPHIRPIVRGKAGKPVEFGAKLSVSCCEGYVFLDRISWDNFNESGDLKSQIEAYYNLTGYYPQSVHVDRIYRSRENRAWCKERGIRISGPPLGRPPAHVSKEKKKQAREDEKIRNTIEEKFGQAKRRFSLNRVMAKLSHTSQTAIAITFLVMNLSTWLLRVFCAFLCQELKTTSFHHSLINFYYLWVQLKQFQLMSATALNPSKIFLSRSRTYSASPKYDQLFDHEECWLRVHSGISEEAIAYGWHPAQKLFYEQKFSKEFEYPITLLPKQAL